MTHPRKPKLSLRNRVALIFGAITLLAIGSLYIYVAPGLQTRLINNKLSELFDAARRESTAIAHTVTGTVTLHTVKSTVASAANGPTARVTLFSVSTAVTPGGPQLSLLADSSSPHSAPPLAAPVAYRAVRERRPATGTEATSAGIFAEAAIPISYQGRVVRVLVYSAPVSDVVKNVAVVRHEILVAGGLALLLALVGGYLVARALSMRVKRLERAVERVAARDFDYPIPVDSTDELGQLALALRDMQRQLFQLETARKKFIATASHELRTPIFSLGGFVELLEDEDLDADTRRRFLGQVSEQVERLRKLSVDLLDLSKLEAGSLELRFEQVDLGELTRSVSSEFEPKLDGHDSHLELRLARRVEAHCDPVRVAQIVRILIDNALIHTAPGTQIVVTAARDNGSVRLAVRDNGGGIDRHSMPRIFEPFYTADDAQGSGLGLAIASELAEHMSGRLQAQSAPGDTVFTLELPA